MLLLLLVLLLSLFFLDCAVQALVRHLAQLQTILSSRMAGSP